MTSQLAVHRASAADTGRVTEIITLAFAHDPLWAHAMARPDGGTAHHAEFWRLFVEGALRYPDTWLTSGGEATSIWIPPGGTEMTPEQEQQLAASPPAAWVRPRAITWSWSAGSTPRTRGPSRTTT
jgi:hypothetical protein